MSDSKHTKGPWVVNENGEVCGDVDEYNYVTIAEMVDSVFCKDSKENAKRIVTCVNALEGIDDVEKREKNLRREIVLSLRELEGPVFDINIEMVILRLETALALFPNEKE